MSAILPDYGASADGHLAARVGDIAYIAVPCASGFRLASGWQPRRRIGEWSEADVYGSEGIVPDAAGFRAHVEDVARHLTQCAALGRKEVCMRVSTPWGMSQGATIYAEGVVCHSTASHGGFKLDRARNAALHPALRLKGGWYEEDGDWARVAVGYPDLFTDREKRSADRTLRDWEPDTWEAVHGRMLRAEESFTRDRQRFEREHTADWVVISAVTSKRHPGFIETIAAIGGRRDGSDRCTWLVPAAEYSAGRHGFVIDPARAINRYQPDRCPFRISGRAFFMPASQRRVHHPARPAQRHRWLWHGLADHQRASRSPPVTSGPDPCLSRSHAVVLAARRRQMCKVLNKRLAGVPENAVYIGRGSKWGNPFVIGRDGDRAEVIARYSRWLRRQHQLLRALDELRGCDLVCYCAPLPCHGDLLLWLARASRQERIIWWRSAA